VIPQKSPILAQSSLGGSDDLAVMLDSKARAGAAEMSAATMAGKINVERINGIPSFAPIYLK
jgi:hypothetical protein